MIKQKLKDSGGCSQMTLPCKSPVEVFEITEYDAKVLEGIQSSYYLMGKNGYF